MVLTVMLVSAVVLLAAGRFYSRFLARSVGEDNSRPTPAVARNDGRDYVPTPTWIVFAHHFASIAGAGPIVGPVLAIGFGWLPALLWVLIGGVFFGAVHDYLATYMATRTGGESMASLARKMLGRGPFVAFSLLLVVMLTLVCAQFLNLSAAALTSNVEMVRLNIDDPGIFRVADDGKNIIIGGIASMSVIVITLCAPLVGYLYIKKQVAVWKCSVLAVIICGVSITAGLFVPVSLKPLTWQLMLSAYVLVAAGVPVWLFLQSRDFVNVHILYAGLAVLLIVLMVGGWNGAHLEQADQTFQAGKLTVSHSVQPVSLDLGQSITKGWIWPMLFITVACGAVSGFHSLCAGGTTSKQLVCERACRQIGYYGMLLESFLAVCVIAVMMIGLDMQPYVRDVYPKMMSILDTESNPAIAFAMAVGQAAHLAIGAPVVVGALAGMVLLEGFIVTTLDTAVRLTRYLLEEIWRALFEKYDVFAAPGHEAPAAITSAEIAGAGGITAGLDEGQGSFRGQVIPTRGLARSVLKLLRHYWVNSGLVVGIMLIFALSGGVTALWSIFGSTNQLLAALVLSLASLWLLRQGRRVWFAVIPAIVMMVTTSVALVQLLMGYIRNPAGRWPLLIADVIVICLTAYLLVVGIHAAGAYLRRANQEAAPIVTVEERDSN